MTLDYPTLKIIWWLFIGILMIGFAIMDGFDMGIGALLPFIGKNDDERRVLLNVVGPTWEGNQVWLITAGGALFAAWPLVYATAFSGFYFTILLALFALFLRPVGFDYRSKLQHKRWRQSWDWSLCIGGAVPALVFGIAFGNLLQGVPFHFDEQLRSFYTGSFWDLLNPFALLSGIVSLSLLLLQGAVYLQWRTEEVIYQRCRLTVRYSATVLFITFTLAGFAIAFLIDGYQITSGAIPAAPANPLHKLVITETGSWMRNYSTFAWLWLLPASTYCMLLLTVLFSHTHRPGLAFLCSSLLVAAIILTAGFSMFPFLMPSISHPSSSLTIWDSSSSEATLRVMFWATIILLPLVISYTSWVYRIMRGKITVAKILENEHNVY